MTGEKKALLQKKIHEMGTVASLFYTMAQGIGVHQFLEHAGLLNEYVKACTKMLETDIDFVENNVQLLDYMAEYIGEKIGCIYGAALEDEKLLKAFMDGLQK